MYIPGIDATDQVFGTQDTYATTELDQGAFMELLVTQLEHQDPLEPVPNEDFIAQLATFSSLEELESLNQNIVAMIALNQSNALLSQLTQASALIGKTVAWVDPTTGEPGTGTVDSVKIVDGLAVLSIGGEDIPLATVTEVLGGDGSGDGGESGS
ncbi:MAG: flagellar hook capping FlgD N-terminal domain-containing protein [Planctomycetota bacterium]